MAKRIQTAKVSIDVGEKTIKIIKTDAKGVIKRAGLAHLPDGISDASGTKYIDALAETIKRAASIARVGRSKNCVVVAGGPRIITRAFTWPEMPPDALLLNAELEITPYLPAEPELFCVDYTLLRRKTAAPNGDGHQAVQLEVLVGAMEKEFATALLSAARKAGFPPKRIDIRENTRGKLVHATHLWTETGIHAAPGTDTHSPAFSPEKSFAILDVADTLVSMTVFINGMFYAHRYFGAAINTSVPVEAYAAGGIAAAGAPSKDASLSESRTLVDADNLANEVASIIDYIHYRERDSKVSSILLFGSEDNVPNLMQNLSEQLEIPVFRPSNELEHRITCSKPERINVSNYLDAYGAAIVPQTGRAADLDLKPKKKKRHIFKRFVLPTAGIALLVGVFLTVGVYLPYQNVQKLQQEDIRLQAQLEQYNTITETDIALLEQELAEMGQISLEFEGFHAYSPAAFMVLDSMYNALPADAAYYSVTIADGTVVAYGSTDSLEKVAALIVSLRENPLITSASSRIVTSYSIESEAAEDELVAVDFELTLILTSATGRDE